MLRWVPIKRNEMKRSYQGRERNCYAVYSAQCMMTLPHLSATLHVSALSCDPRSAYSTYGVKLPLIKKIYH